MVNDMLPKIKILFCFSTIRYENTLQDFKAIVSHQFYSITAVVLIGNGTSLALDSSSFKIRKLVSPT